jgi:hypothetical protein
MLLVTGSPTLAKTIGIVRVSRWTAAVAGAAFVKMMSGCKADQLLRKRAYPTGVTAGPAKVYLHVAALGPTQVRKGLRERRKARPHHRLVFVERDEHADPPHAVTLLRPRHHRPRGHAPEPRDELPTLH